MSTPIEGSGTDSEHAGPSDSLDGGRDGSSSHPSYSNPEDLLDTDRDPGGVAFGTGGFEGSGDVPWYELLRQKVGERAAKSERHQWWVLGALMAGLLALNITFTVFNIALTSISHEFGTSTAVLSWTMTGPLLAFGLAAPIFGRAGDLFGHRRLYLFGLGGAMVSAVLTALATNTAMLLFARALDGVQGAATGVASAALINVIFKPGDRVKALGWWSLVGAGGPVLGVSVGGPIIALFGWRALFWGQFVLLGIAFIVVATILAPSVGMPEVPGSARTSTRTSTVAALRSRPEVVLLVTGVILVLASISTLIVEAAPLWVPLTMGVFAALFVGIAVRLRRRRLGQQSRWQGTDWVGSWLLSASITTGMIAVTFLNSHPWTWAGIWVLAVISVASGIGFIYRDVTAENPLIPPRYFKKRNFTFPLGVRSFAAFAYFGGFFLFPLLMIQGYGWTEGGTSLISIARPIVFAISSPVAGYMAVKVGERTTALFGTIALTCSLVLFGLCVEGTSVVWIVVALALSGIGMGVAMPSASSTMANQIDASEFGVMSAAGLIATQVGEVVGINVLVTLQHKSAAHHTASALASFHLPFFIGAAVGALAIICAFFMRSMKRTTEAASPIVPA